MPAEPLIGQIMMFGGNFAPSGWALCNGQLVAISQNSALFALIGTIYGGDGQVTFALPNLQGRTPVHQGQGPGLANYVMGQTGGQETVALTTNQLPAHTHPNAGTVGACDGPATATDPVGRVFAIPTDGSNAFASAGAAAMGGGGTLPIQGGNTAHDNMQPYQCVNFVIALFGIFPTRN